METAENFVAVEVKWTAQDGVPFTLDRRPESTFALGFHPDEKVITPSGVATVIGVTLGGKLVFELRSSSKVISFPYTTKEEFEHKGFRAIRTDNEKQFVAVAVERKGNDGCVEVIDTRLEKMLAFGFHPNEQVVTPSGLAKVCGVNVDGKLLWERHDTGALLIFCHSTREEYENADFQTIRTDEDKALAAAFLSVAVAWTSKDGLLYVVDTRPETMLPLGFRPNERAITPFGLVTMIGVNIHGKYLLDMVQHPTVIATPFFLTREDFEKAKFHPIRTEKDEHFLRIAVEWIAQNKELFFLDTRPATIAALGFDPNERVITPQDGLATFIGVRVDGRPIFDVSQSVKPLSLPHTTKDALARAGVRAIRSDKAKAFVAAAIEWKAKNGDVYILDTRPEATQKLGFYLGERAITPRGVATVIGIDIDGGVLFEAIGHNAVFLLGEFKNDVKLIGGIHTIRTAADEAFLAVAVEWTAKSGLVFCVDTRPEAMLPFGFKPNEFVSSQAGLGTFVGVGIEGSILFCSVGDTNAVYLPFETPAEFEERGIRILRTAEEKAFASIAVNWRTREGEFYPLDTRPESMSACGFRPNEQIITPRGVAIVKGLDMNGDVAFDLQSGLTPFLSELLTKEAFEENGFYVIRTEAEKKFLSVAKKFYNEDGEYVFLDIRRETIIRHGFTYPRERFYNPPIGPAVCTVVAGVDIRGCIAVRGHQVGSLTVLLLPFRTRSQLVTAPCFQPLPHPATASAAAMRKKKVTGSAVSLLTVAPTTVKTVTLPSGAVYTGAHTRAGQRHGNGTMRGADRSWRYKGQWQQGRPHGAGVLRMTIESGRGTSRQTVYEGRWVLGVPHGRGTLRVESVSDKRRYRGRWAHGRRAMTAAEVVAVRLSGGTAFASHLAKNDARKNTQQKKTARLAPARPSPTAAVFASHDEVERMVAAVAVACSDSTVPATGVKKHLRPRQASTTTAASVCVPAMGSAVAGTTGRGERASTTTSVPTSAGFSSSVLSHTKAEDLTTYADIQPHYSTRTRALRRFLALF